LVGEKRDEHRYLSWILQLICSRSRPERRDIYARRTEREHRGAWNRRIKLHRSVKVESLKETSNEFVTFYTTRSEATPKVHEDTQKLEAFSVDQINNMLEEGSNFTPIFLTLFNLYKGYI
jgi:hypothetical protein